VTTCRDKSSRDVTHTLSVYILCVSPQFGTEAREATCEPQPLAPFALLLVP